MSGPTPHQLKQATKLIRSLEQMHAPPEKTAEFRRAIAGGPDHLGMTNLIRRMRRLYDQINDENMAASF